MKGTVKKQPAWKLTLPFVLFLTAFFAWRGAIPWSDAFFLDIQVIACVVYGAISYLYTGRYPWATALLIPFSILPLFWLSPGTKEVLDFRGIFLLPLAFGLYGGWFVSEKYKPLPPKKKTKKE